MEYVIGALQRRLTRASLPFNPALVETETRDLKFETETRGFKICAFCRNVSKIVVITSDHGRPQGGKRAFPPLEIETKHQDSLENMKLVAQFR